MLGDYEQPSSLDDGCRKTEGFWHGLTRIDPVRKDLEDYSHTGPQGAQRKDYESLVNSPTVKAAAWL